MKIDANSVFGKVQEAAETLASKAKEVAANTGSTVKQTVEQGAAAMQSMATEAKGNLQLVGDATRANLNNTLYGASEGFDAGKKSGEQAHSDTTAHGPKSIAGLAGGIAGGISGAIDGYNVGNSGGSVDDIRNKARANAEFTGADAAQKSMFLDFTESERLSYGDYKHYQANGGTMSYDEWLTETSKDRGVSSAPVNQPTSTSEDTRVPRTRPNTWEI